MTSRGPATAVAIPTPPRNYEKLREVLLAERERLPNRLLRIATIALEKPDEIAFGTVASVALQAFVQPSTVVRFAQTLGYAGFSDLRDVFRSELRSRWLGYRERMARLAMAEHENEPNVEALLAGFAESAIFSIERTTGAMGNLEIDRASEILADADTIYVLGMREAFPVAAHLFCLLGKLGLDAVWVDNVGGLAPEQLGGASTKDALIAVSFAPYTPLTVDLSGRAAEARVPVIVFTDSVLSALAPSATVRFEILEADYCGFRSLAAAFCVATVLALATAARSSR